ncbi:MAG: hypothetical protein HKM05_08255 [Spirochaetales bacterium]|nr:hypothetical protein [Spirochaetales bacterium]
MNENVIVPPPYIRFDKRQREELLSQFGVTAPAQRDLFHQLCDSWRPFVDFDSFVGARLGQFPHVETEMVNLLARLKAAKLGMLTYKKNSKGDRSPDKILLCSEGEKRFWFAFLQDLIQTACENPNNPFLTLSLLKSRELTLPVEFLQDLSPENVSKSGFEESAKSETLFLLTLQEEKILATSQTLNLLMSFSVSKLRLSLKNPEVLTMISRWHNIPLSELTRKVDEKDLGFWKTLTETVIKQREDLSADRKLHLEKSFFQAAEFFRIYTGNQLEELRRQKEEQQDRQTDLRQMEQLILKDKEVLMPENDLDGHVRLLFAEKYGEKFAGLQEEFRQQFMTNSQKTGLSPIVVLKAGLVHRDNLYQFFVKRFEILQNLVWQDFANRMERLVRTSNRTGDLTFVNKDNLEHALSDWVGKNDTLVAELLDHPKLLAEALIHFGKNSLQLGSVEEMQALMEQLFRPGTMKIRPLQEIFGIDVLQLYEAAFRHLNVVTQFWKRLTGQYKAQEETFATLRLGSVKPLSIRVALGAGLKAEGARPKDPSADKPLESLTPEERKVRQKDWQERRRATARSADKGSEKPEKAPPVRVNSRHYSEKEQDSAWTSFRDTLTKE